MTLEMSDGLSSLCEFVRNGIIPAMPNRIFETDSNDYQTIEASDIR